MIKNYQVELDYSLRRYYIDEFYFHHIPSLFPGTWILDLGGNKIRKRGNFDLDRYDMNVVYANLSIEKQPDIQTDAVTLPFKSNSLGAVICAELFEHVINPIPVLSEVYRILYSGGFVLITAPFLTRIHGDPYDYGRYTDAYWMQALNCIGFQEIQIEKQGLFFSVLTDMIRELLRQIVRQKPSITGWLIPVITRVLSRGAQLAVSLD